MMRHNYKNSHADQVVAGSAWHSCNTHVYNVTTRQPFTADYQHYSNAMWVVLSRQGAEYLVTFTQGVLDPLHFYLMTSLIPDECYIINVLRQSNVFSSTVLHVNLHHFSKFEGQNKDSTCRHSEEADICGQGPGLMTEKSLPQIQTAAQHMMFARKFSLEPEDKARQEVLKSVRHQTYLHWTHQKYNSAAIRSLMHSAVTHLIQDMEAPPILTFSNLTWWKVIPRLTPDNPCCMSPVRHGRRFASQFFFLMEAEYLDKKKQAPVRIRSSFTSHPNAACFADGHIRAIAVGVNPKPNSLECTETRSQPTPWLTAPPQSGVCLTMFVDVIKEKEQECIDQTVSENMSQSNYSSFPPPSKWRQKHTMTFYMTLTSPSDVTFCRDTLELSLSPKELHPTSKTHIHTELLSCGTLTEQGRWTLTLRDRDVGDAFDYKHHFYVLEANATTSAWMTQVWLLEEVAIIPDDVSSSEFKSNRSDGSLVNRHVMMSHARRPSAYRSHVDQQRSLLRNTARDLHGTVYYTVSSIHITYYILFGIAVVIAAAIYNMSLSHHRSFTTALRRSTFRRRHLVFISLIGALQMLFYWIGHLDHLHRTS